MNRASKSCLLAVLLPLLSGCHESGTWENHAKNWKRVFGAKQPKDIKVLNSWYWRSPHFTHEFEYFFAIAPNDTFRKRALEPGKLLDFTPTTREEREQVQQFFHSKPSWFIPKPIESYEVWQGKPPREHFRLFIDRQTGDLFFTEFLRCDRALPSG